MFFILYFLLNIVLMCRVSFKGVKMYFFFKKYPTLGISETLVYE